jgi:hypothetical protein
MRKAEVDYRKWGAGRGKIIEIDSQKILITPHATVSIS